MEREDHSYFLHLIGQQAISFNHNKSVTCLEGHDNIVEIVLYTHVQPFHDSFFHCQRCVAVKVGYPVSERAMIQSDPYCCSVCFAYFDESCKLFSCLLVILVEVARIDPDLFYNLRSGYGNL